MFVDYEHDFVFACAIGTFRLSDFIKQIFIEDSMYIFKH